jgi:hypothetical protein
MNKLMLFLVVVLLFSCRVKKDVENVRNTEPTLGCKLYQKDFKIFPLKIRAFNNELESFYESSWKYDFLEIYISGGGSKYPYIKRWYQDENRDWIYLESQKKTKFNLNLGDEQKLLNNSNLSKGNYKQMCSSSINNDSYLYLMKINGKIEFKLSLQYSYPISLSEQEKRCIEVTMNMFSLLTNTKGTDN